MTKLIPVITVDGPSSVGKGTLCKEIAKILGWNILDSGAIYRVLALIAIRRDINLTLEEISTLLSMHLGIRFFNNGNLKTFFEREDVSDKIRTQEVSNVASLIATFPYVRKSLLHYQRTFRRAPGLVADGRDMGTEVFPDASVKIFLYASLKARINRRLLQLQKHGIHVNMDRIAIEIKDRDYRDINRDIAPLIPSQDALFLDSTNLTIEQVIEKSIKYADEKLHFT